MNKAVMIAVLLLLGACAGNDVKKEAVKIPAVMEPNHGMTSSRAKGLGEASKFMK